MCRTSISNTSVENWYNDGFVPGVLDSSDPRLGLKKVSVQSLDGRIHCYFTRDNTNPAANYYNINNASLPFIISAFGSGNFNLFKHNNIYFFYSLLFYIHFSQETSLFMEQIKDTHRKLLVYLDHKIRQIQPSIR